MPGTGRVVREDWLFDFTLTSAAKLLWRLLFALILLNGLLGCGVHMRAALSTAEALPVAPPPGAHLSTVGVGSIGSTPEPDFETPPKGWSGGARRGAWLGAGVPIKAGAVGAVVGVALENGSGGGVLLAMASLGAGLVLAPAAAVVGAVVGAAKAEPAEKIEGSERALTNAAAGARLGELVRDHVIELGRQQTPAAFAPVLEGEDRPAADGLVEISVTRLSLKPWDAPGQGLFNLREGWRGDPPLRLELAVRARLQQASGVELAAREFVYYGGVLAFSEWTAGEATAFAGELERGSRSIADDIVRAWFAAPKIDAAADADRGGDRGEGEGP